MAAAEARQATGQAQAFVIWSSKGMTVSVQAIGLGEPLESKLHLCQGKHLEISLGP